MIRGLILCISFLPVVFAGQIDGCNDPIQARGWESSPVHREGMRLGRDLESQGLKVECMRRSKEENLFEGQKGAAWVKTDYGIFEAWFLPGNETFEKLEIKETLAGNGRYLYSFSGLAHVPPTLDSSQPIAFIKNGSRLFEVWGNRALAAVLRQRLSDTK